MPRVSIGLPVYNGERYLAEALDSLLAQTFEDFEIVVTDNASTDRTAAIAQDYARRDPRIRYHRNRENVGAAANFNLSFGLSTGEYFKWAACDDRCAPELLARCVAALDRDSEVTLAHSLAMKIDEDGQRIGPYTVQFETSSPDPVRRFQALVRGHACYQIFGLIRRRALESTPCMGAYSHGDGVLLVRLGLQGPFAEIPEYLFFPRTHRNQSAMMIGDNLSYAAWFDPKLAGRRLFPCWRILFEYWRSLFMVRLATRRRLRCHVILARYAWSVRRWLVRDLVHHLRHPFGRPAPIRRVTEPEP